MSKIKLSVNNKEVVETDGKPELIKGGNILSLGNGFYYINGNNPKKTDDVDVDIINSKKGVRVFSDEDMLGGKSPADLVLEGANPNQVFAAQEQYKQIHGINDDGTKKKAKDGGIWSPIKRFFGINDNIQIPVKGEIEENDSVIFDYNGKKININKNELDILPDTILSYSINPDEVIKGYDYTKKPKTRHDLDNSLKLLFNTENPLISIDKTNKTIKNINKEEYSRTIRPKYEYLSRDDVNKTVKALKRIQLYDKIKELSDNYGVNPNLVAHRFIKEGAFDKIINDFNWERTPQQQKEYDFDEDYKNILYDNYDALGLDTFKELYDKGKINIKNDELNNYIKNVNTVDWKNEKGHPIKRFKTNIYQALELYGAFFKYLKDKYPNADLETLNAMFNRGEKGIKAINKTELYKKYSVPKYYADTIHNKKQYGGMSKAKKDTFIDSLIESMNSLNKTKLNNTNSDNMSPIDLQILDKELNKDVLLGHTPSTGVQSKKCGGRIKAVMGTDGKDYTSIDKMPFGVFPAEANYNKSNNKYNENDVARGKRAVNAMHWLTYGLGAGTDMLSAIIGSSIEHRTTNKAINKIKELIGKVKSYNLALPNYNTHVEVEPQLAENRRTSAYLKRNVDADIIDSKRALDMKRQIEGDKLYKDMLIEQYKVNEENKLRNFKTKEQYNIINENIRNATNIENEKLSMMMGMVDKQAENDANLTRNIIGGINSGVRTLLTGLNQKEQMMIAGIDSPEGDNATYGTIGKRIREREEEKERKRKERENKRKSKNNKFDPFKQNDLLIG